MSPGNDNLRRDGTSEEQITVRDAESALVKRIAAGDDTAYEIVVDGQLARLLALSRRMLGDEAEAEDVVQEVFLRLWQNAGKFDPERARLSTWLHRITANLCIDRLRGRKEMQVDELPEQEESAEQDRKIAENQLSKRMEKALQDLPERQRLALVLFHYQELTMSDTAGIMDSSVDAVESLLRRARQNLKLQLENDWANFLPDEGH